MISDLPVIDSTPSSSSAPSARKPALVILGSSLGMLAPFACAVHCAAMPFVIAYLPALGLSFLADEAFHQWMVLGCLGIALSAFVPGFRKHGRLTPAIVGCIGLVMISGAAFGFAGECCPTLDSDGKTIVSTEAGDCTEDSCCPVEHDTQSKNDSTDSRQTITAASVLSIPGLEWIGPWLAPAGGLFLVAAHLLNHRQCSCCSVT